MRREAVLAVVLPVLSLPACGGDGERAARPDVGDEVRCPPADAALAGATDLPPSFPTPDGVVYTGTADAGPTTIVDGFAGGAIADWFETYRDALARPPYEVRDDEQELRDAEVAFAGAGTTGQVKLVEVCDGRVSIRITVRPD